MDDHPHRLWRFSLFRHLNPQVICRGEQSHVGFGSCKCFAICFGTVHQGLVFRIGHALYSHFVASFRNFSQPGWNLRRGSLLRKTTIFEYMMDEFSSSVFCFLAVAML